MQPYWMRDFGNPHSEGHPYGWKARQAVEYARSRIAAFLNADDDEIVFTSGATESCNIALRGVAAASRSGDRKRIITLATEHPAVLQTVLWLGNHGYEAVILPVGPDGLLDMVDLEAALGPGTLLVSVMLANNEIGVVQPLAEISHRCRAAGAFLHTDATQAAGRIGIDVDELGVDLLSLSGHKVYGPNGVGGLYIRNRSDMPLEPVATGGAQERGIRPGTIPVPLAVGMGEACAVADDALEEDAKRFAYLGGRLLRELSVEFPDLRVFGHAEQRIPGSLSIGIPGVLGEQLVDAVSGDVAIATGAACASGSPKPSHVLVALGVGREITPTGVRISLGRYTTEDEIDAASRHLRCAVRELTGRG